MSLLEAVPDVPLIKQAIVTASAHDVVMACRRFPHYWSFLRRIHWCTPIMNSQGCGSLSLFAVTLLQLLNKQSVESPLIQTSLGSFDVTIIKRNSSVVKILLHMQFDLMKLCSIFLIRDGENCNKVVRGTISKIFTTETAYISVFHAFTFKKTCLSHRFRHRCHTLSNANFPLFTWRKNTHDMILTTLQWVH